VGVTNNLERRLYEHKQKLVPGFTSKYRIDRLVFFETTPSVLSANRAGKADQELEKEQESRSYRTG